VVFIPHAKTVARSPRGEKTRDAVDRMIVTEAKTPHVHASRQGAEA